MIKTASWQTEKDHTMAIVEELCDVECTTWGPGKSFVEVNEERSHHMMPMEMSKQLPTDFRIIMWHAEYMAWKKRGK